MEAQFFATRQEMIDARVAENAASQQAYTMKSEELAERDTRYVNELQAKEQAHAKKLL